MEFDNEITRTSETADNSGKYYADFGLEFNNIEKFYDQIKADSAEWAKNTYDTEVRLKALQEIGDEIKQQKADELAYERERYKLNVQIENLKSKNDKQSKKRIKDLEAQKKIAETIYNFNKKNAELKKEQEATEKARKEAEDTGMQMMKEGNLKEKIAGFKLWATEGQEGAKGVGRGIEKGLDKILSKIGDLVKKLDSSIEEIVQYKSDWDTRLFGSNSSHKSLVESISNSIGISPFVKQADIMKNIDKAVEAGIAYNVEQRAFLESVKDDIASTFNAFDSTLLQIIRVQQSDSTAARLGMEASLNQFFNSMYANTEYLNNLSDTVTGSLYEATSLLSSNDSIGFEYQVQKWLGSLYSVGMSSGAIGSIAEALGALGSGDVSATESGAGKLLVMAASRAGLDYSQLLTQGLDDSEMNSLLKSMVSYLGEIANSNKVVQTQYAAIYGLHTSDIMAAQNLQSSINNISKYGLSYSGGINALNQMAGTIASRQNMGEWLENATSNLEYTLASGIASNPALYGIWKVSNMLDQLVGGISIPSIMAVGSGVDLETTVADLMRVGALGASLTSSIGGLTNSFRNLGSAGIQGILSNLGVSNKTNSITRGSGLSGSGLSETTVSQRSYIGNEAGNDVTSAGLTSAEDQKRELQVSAEEESNAIKLEDVNDNIIKIYDILNSIISGGKMNVRFGSDFSFLGLGIE